MHFQIGYETEYRYEAEVIDNLNALRVRPATTSTQRCDDFHVRIDPEVRLHQHADYFGTEVIEFGVARPHERLSIEARSRVTTADPDEPPEGTWEALASPGYRAAAGEFLMAVGNEPDPERVRDLVELVRARSPMASLRLLAELIPDRFAYRQGATYVGSTVDDLLDAGAGVCQDYVHLATILLRAHGIAARYVSGYFWSAPADGGDDSVEVDTHAWLEALVPSTDGVGSPVWVGVDPTNRRLADETHVKIGHGRWYQDVPPIRGVFRGHAATGLHARVGMTRLDPQASARA